MTIRPGRNRATRQIRRAMQEALTDVAAGKLLEMAPSFQEALARAKNDPNASVKDFLRDQASDFLALHRQPRARVKFKTDTSVKMVYVIGAVGFPVKIGIAANVHSRRRELQTAFPSR